MDTENNDDTVVMSRWQRVRAWRPANPNVSKILVVLAVVVALVASMGVGAFINDRNSRDTASATPTPTATPETDLGLAAEDLNEIVVDFEKGQVKIGGDEPIPASEREAASESFTGETIETREDLEEFFKSDLPKAELARDRVVKCFKKHKLSDKEITRAVNNGDRWIWVAPTVPSQIEGTTYTVGGKVHKIEEPRGVASNDAVWFYVTEKGHVFNCGAVRADCGNPEVTRIRPIKPGHRVPSIRCFRDCDDDDDVCVAPPKPEGPHSYNPKTCTWSKQRKADPGAFSDYEQNQSPARQDPQDNDHDDDGEDDVNTGPTEDRGDGDSSPSDGGDDSAPEGGDSEGGGGSEPDNEPEDSGQGGDNDAEDNDSVVNPD